MREMTATWPSVNGRRPAPEPEREHELDLDRRVADVCARLGRVLEPYASAGGQTFQAALDVLAGLATGGQASWSPASGLRRLVTSVGCSPVEVDLLVLAGLADEDEAFAALFRSLHPRGEPRPTVGLAARACCDDLAERPLLVRALEEGRAVATGVLQVRPPDAPLFERTLAPADGLWLALRGIEHWPDTSGHRVGKAALAGLDEWLATGPVETAMRVITRGEPRSIIVTGETADIALERAVAMVERAGVDWARFAPVTVEAGTIGLIGVHALVRGVVPIIRVPVGDNGSEPPTADLAAYPGPVVLAARTGTPIGSPGRTLVPVPVEPLDAPSRRRMWQHLIPGIDGPAGSAMARHIVEPALAAGTADDVHATAALDGRSPGLGDVIASLRARGGLTLSPGVTLIRPVASWDQLILPRTRIAQLHDAVGRLRHQERVLEEWGFLAGRRGARGVRMLFAGPPGTGKTLAAEVLARELGVDLLVVDLARIVSKWIGETEKNLAEVFDAAERVNGVLLFDEADALFGKRTEVSDAHDRYANLETAYLLARLERSEGLVILATNLRANVDPAFTRRLEAVVTFEEPGLPERVALWRCHIPSTAPLAGDLDIEELATLFPVVGGVIRNAAVAAAFLAASDGGRIRREHVIRAIQREYEKHGRAFPAIPGTTSNDRTRR